MNPEFNIFLVRHGQSEANVDSSKHVGVDQFDHLVELTDLGKQQARACAGNLEGIAVGLEFSVLVSPYARAQQTWLEISQNLKSVKASEVITDGRLREQEFKDFKTLEELQEKKIRAKQRGKLYYRYKNAESGYDVLNRVGGFYNQLRLDLMLGNRQKNVLIVAHEIVIRCFLMLALDIDPEKYGAMDIENGELLWLAADSRLKFSLK